MTKVQLRSKLFSLGIEVSHLVDITHDAASVLASNANNGGMECQIDFLMDTCGWSAEDIIKAAEAQ